MGRRYTDEEKDAMIRQMVEFGRANHYFTAKKLTEEFTKAYNDTVSETWIRQKYEMTLREYMTQEGAIMDDAHCREYANELYRNLVKAYEGKPRIELMTLDD